MFRCGTPLSRNAVERTNSATWRNIIFQLATFLSRRNLRTDHIIFHENEFIKAPVWSFVRSTCRYSNERADHGVVTVDAGKSVPGSNSCTRVSRLVRSDHLDIKRLVDVERERAEFLEATGARDMRKENWHHSGFFRGSGQVIRMSTDQKYLQLPAQAIDLPFTNSYDTMELENSSLIISH